MRRIILSLALMVMTMALMIPEAQANEAPKGVALQESLMFGFENSEEIEPWRIVNDGVMGGFLKAKSSLAITIPLYSEEMFLWKITGGLHPPARHLAPMDWTATTEF